MAILRFIGLINAGIWLGSICFLIVLLPLSIFSADMKLLLGAGYGAYSGAIAQLIFKSFFKLQFVTGAVALLHLLFYWLSTGRPLQKLHTLIVLFLFSVSLVGGLWLQPKMKDLFKVRHGQQYSVEQRAAATKSFKRWHGASQTINLFVLIALVTYMWRLQNPPEAPRFSSSKFRS